MGRRKSSAELSQSLVDYLLRNENFDLAKLDGATGHGNFSYESPLAKAARELKRPLSTVKYQWRNGARTLFVKYTRFCACCKKEVTYSKGKSQWCQYCKIMFHERLACAKYLNSAWQCKKCKQV